MSSPIVLSAVRHLRDTGNVNEALAIVLGRIPPPKPVVSKAVKEDAGPQSPQTQTWYLPNEDTINRAVLYLKNKLPDASVSISEYSQGAQGGYALTVTGTYSDGDISSTLGSLKGMRLDVMSASLPGAAPAA